MFKLFDFAKNPSITLLGFFSFFLILYSQIYAGKGLLEKPRHLLSPPTGIENLTFGHRDVIADFLWIRAIQDFDYCDQEIAQNLCGKEGDWLYDYSINLCKKICQSFTKIKKY